MKKRRFVVTVREGVRLLDALGSVSSGNCKSLYTSPNDIHAGLHRYPLASHNADIDRDLHKERYYHTLGRQGKEWYRTYTVDAATDAEAERLMSVLRENDALIDECYEDGRIRFAADPQDTRFNEQRPLFDKLFIEDAWDLAPRLGAGVLTAILDTGVQPDHPDLISNLWMQGADVVGFPANNHIMSDDDGHGTAVCGIIGAAGNTVGIIGIAPAVKLQVHMLKLGGDTAFMSACTTAMLRARDTNCQLVNCSFMVVEPIESESVRKFQAAVNALSSRLLFVFSAGNNGKHTDKTFLSGLNNVLIAGALSSDDRRPDYSNFGRDVVYAYGDILSTSNDKGNDIFRLTSAAAPQLTGICALMLSIQPFLSPAQIKAIIENTTDPLPFVPTNEGKGKVNAKRALEKVIHDFGLA